MIRKRSLTSYPPGRAGLKLQGYCIETAARTELKRLEYLMYDMSGGDPDLLPIQERHSIITRFLERVDFPALRTARPELDGRTEMKVVIWEQADGNFILEDVIPTPPGEDGSDAQA